MKIGILFNCQGQGIAAALEAMLPGVTTDYIPIAGLEENRRAQADAAARLLACDHVISHRLHASFGPLASVRMHRSAKSYQLLPGLSFRGFHPDTVYVTDNGRHVAGVPTGDYHSRIAIVGFLAHLLPGDAAALFNALVFRRLGYLDLYDSEMLMVVEHFRQYDIDANDLMAGLRQQGCFMHSINHPKRVALLRIGQLACRRLGETPRDIHPDDVPDFLAHHGTHPVLPDIAAHLGLITDNAYYAGASKSTRSMPISPEDFVRASYDYYPNLDPMLLLQSDGVAAAMKALGLRAAATARGGRAGSARRGLALLTTEGTVLRARGLAVAHAPAEIADAQIPMLRIDLDVALPAGRDVLGGVRADAAPKAGWITLAREGHYLSASAENRADFSRFAAGDHESFWPISDGDIAVLADLLAGEWRREVPATSPTAAVRLLPGPIAALGELAIALTPDWPRRLKPGPDGMLRLGVTVDARSMTICQAVRPEPVVAPPPPPPRIAPGQPFLVTGDRVWQPPPLTLNDADRLWLHTHCADPAGLAYEVRVPSIRLHRAVRQALPASGWPDSDAWAAAGLPAIEPVCALISPAGEASPSFWIAALLRLFAMRPHLPPEAVVLVPAGPAFAATLNEACAAIGAPPQTCLEAPPTDAVASDLTWLLTPDPADWPAGPLLVPRAALAAQAPAKPATAAKLFLVGPAAAAIGNLAALRRWAGSRGYTVLDLQAGPADCIAALRAAPDVIGVGADLLATVFCPATCRVIELCSDAAFMPAAWRVSCRLGLTHAVLPCAAAGDLFVVDENRLWALARVLWFRM